MFISTGKKNFGRLPKGGGGSPPAPVDPPVGTMQSWSPKSFPSSSSVSLALVHLLLVLFAETSDDSKVDECTVL